MHTLKDGNLQEWYSNDAYPIEDGMSVLDVLNGALTEAGMSVEAVDSYYGGKYIASVTKDGVTLREFSNGEASGWMYMLNDTYPYDTVDQQSVSNGDRIVLHYSDDYNREYEPDSIALSKNTLALPEGYSDTVTASFTPGYAYTSLTWTSDNESVATVKDTGDWTNSAKITAKKAGTATITAATANGLEASMVVTVKSGIKSVALSQTVFVYDKKVHCPKVTILKNDGKKLSTTYYDVTYSNANSKKPGVQTVKITFKKAYAVYGSKTLRYTIKPAKVKKLAATVVKKDRIKISYSKTYAADGYQISYSTNSNFKNCKTVTTTSLAKTIKNLKSGKKYYIRVRGYRTVKVNGKTKNIYAPWTRIKVKTK